MSPSRWPVRARLTALYTGVFLTAGVLLVTTTYWLVSQSMSRHVDATQSHFASDPGLAEIVQDQVDTYRSDTLERLVAWSTVAVVATLAAAIALGWVLAGRALRPLRQITDTATRIADRSLNERIGLTGPEDEVKELADTIDQMLGRLDRSFDAQRRFVANASHELRTPLAVNRTMLEVALGDPDASEDLRRVGPKLLATNERSERLVEGLLMLARSEQPDLERSAIDLGEVVSTVVNLEQREARQRGVTIAATLRPTPIVGNAVLIERLATNLVQNAVRHGSPNGTAVVRTWHRDGSCVLEVENPGPLLDADGVAELFEPFRRGSGRTSSEGVGLGLSIVRSVAQAHGGTASAQPRANGGLIVHVELPART